MSNHTTNLDPDGVASKFVGPLLVGTLFNVCLFGICLMQAHTYTRLCENDARWIKCLVAWLVLIEAVSSAFASFIAYDYAVRDFGKPEKVLIRTPEFSAFILTIGICSTTVQCFYAWRVKKLLGKPWLANIIYVSAAAQMLCVTGVATGDSIVTSFREFQKFKPVRIIVIIWMVLAPITDLFIAALLVYFLRKKRTGFKNTDSMLNKLTLPSITTSFMTVQTGLITAFDAVIGLLLFLALPDFVHLLFIFTLPELYGVCLLSQLNARSQWQTQLSGEQTYHGWTEGDGETGGVQVTTTVVTNSNSSGGFELSARGDYGEPVFPPRRSTNKTLSVDYFKRSPPPVIGTAAASKNMNAIVINKREREHDPDDGLSIRSLGDDDDYGEDLGSFEKATQLESQPRRPRFQHQHQHQLDGRNLSFLSALPPVAIPTRPPRTRDRQRDIGWRNMI